MTPLLPVSLTSYHFPWPPLISSTVTSSKAPSSYASILCQLPTDHSFLVGIGMSVCSIIWQTKHMVTSRFSPSDSHAFVRCPPLWSLFLISIWWHGGWLSLSWDAGSKGSGISLLWIREHYKSIPFISLLALLSLCWLWSSNLSSCERPLRGRRLHEKQLWVASINWTNPWSSTCKELITWKRYQIPGKNPSFIHI